jgi:hypothetical protein
MGYGGEQSFEETGRPLMLQTLKILLSLASAALPLAEKYWVTVSPVSSRIRDTVLPVAILASIAAVAAGVATARQTTQGLEVGWLSLVVFLATTFVLYGLLDFMPRATSGLYVLFFASFALSMSSFLSAR